MESRSPQMYRRPGSSRPGSPSGNCDCGIGNMWEQGDPELPLPGIPPHNMGSSIRNSVHTPEEVCPVLQSSG